MLGAKKHSVRIVDRTFVESLVETLSLASALFSSVIVNILNCQEICRKVFVYLVVVF